MMQKVVVAGVGMIPFVKPGQSETYAVMGEQAVRLALADAGVGYESVQQAFASYVFGDSTCGQRVLYNVGMTGIPVLNVNNNCASGSSALCLDRSVSIAGQALTTDGAETFKSGDMRDVAGYSMSRAAARKAYEMAGIGAQDVHVVELHDCFAQNELLTYESLGLCPEGGAQKFVDDGDNTYGGKYVVNPSGGLLSKGHPIGATGLAQCTELVQQLRGRAEQRQVEGARIALQHNVGIGGACVVTLYRKD